MVYDSEMRATLVRMLFWRRKDDRLREFAETEAFGARDLARAAEQAQDPWIRRQLILHAKDEVRHARLLEEGTERDASRPGLGASMMGEAAEDRGVDLERMGELPFIAFVHDAERRAVSEFKLHREALGEKGAFFDEILSDEERHVAWTGHALKRFEGAGRADEVKRALRAMQRQRWVGLWLAFARRLSWVTSAVLLTLVYFVVLAPFSLLAGDWARGWTGSRAPDLRRQF